MSENVLPIYSSRSFVISYLAFRPLSHFTFFLCVCAKVCALASLIGTPAAVLRIQVVGGKGRHLETDVEGVVNTHTEERSSGPGK